MSKIKIAKTSKQEKPKDLEEMFVSRVLFTEFAELIAEWLKADTKYHNSLKGVVKLNTIGIIIILLVQSAVIWYLIFHTYA